jgi:thioester reductase-like protein
VNHLDSYARLRVANVDGTRTVLELAAPGTPVHVVSSVSVALAVGANPDVVDETCRVPADRVVPSGYVATKWVGEELVRAAAERGLPVTVHRPGRIAAHSGTGAWGVDDSFWNYIRTIVRLGAVADGALSVAVDLVPVDHVAAGIVALATDPAARDGTYHLVGARPVSVAEVVDAVRDAGVAVRVTAGEEWDARFAAVARAAVADGDRSWASATLLGAGSGSPSAVPQWGRDATAAALAGRGVPEPVLDHAAFVRAVESALRNGFFRTGES